MAQAASGLVNSLQKAARPAFNNFMKYARVELTPPSPREIPEVMRGFSNLLRGARTGAWKSLTVREAGLNTLIAAEIYFVFFLGECVGKRSIVGYHV